jgi:5-methylcytosine-specific restriction endonuclease McrA
MIRQKKKSHSLEEPIAKENHQAEIEAAWLLHTSPRFQFRRVWLERHIVKQKGRCFYCNILIYIYPGLDCNDCKATIDHVIARAMGGADVEDNTVAACAACNTAKADMSKDEFFRHPVRVHRLRQANTPPDRLAPDPKSTFYNADAMMRGVGVRFKGQERTDVEDYCVSESWVKVPAGKSVDRRGRTVTVNLNGPVAVYFRDV